MPALPPQTPKGKEMPAVHTQADVEFTFLTKKKKLKEKFRLTAVFLNSTPLGVTVDAFPLGRQSLPDNIADT